MCKIYLLQVLLALHHNSIFGNLTRKANHLSVASLTKDYHRTATALHLLVCTLNPTLQRRHNRAGGIDNLKITLNGCLVGCRRLSVCSDKHAAVGEAFKIAMIYSL